MFFAKKDKIEIPFIPSYDYEVENQISVWWFERNFSQSNFGKDSHKGTNSCTLITLLTAELIAREKCKTVANIGRLPPEVIKIFGLAILEGNATYSRLSDEGKLPSVNLNIPEAMEGLGDLLRNIQEWFYVHVHVDRDRPYATSAVTKIVGVLRDGLNIWQMVQFQKDYLFVVLIADNRSILLCFDRKNDVISLFDSHNHSSKSGAAITQADWNNLEGMVEWIIGMFKRHYKSQPDVFELSFLPRKDKKK